MTKLGRNDPCHCGSGKKYKKCHLPIDEANRADDDQDSWTADSPDPFASDTALPEDFNLNVSPYPGANSGRIAKLQAERNAAFEYLGRQNEIMKRGKF